MTAYSIDRNGSLIAGLVIKGEKVHNIFNLDIVSMWGEQLLDYRIPENELIDFNMINTQNIEAHAEDVRRRIFPKLPSRYSVMYGCETIEECIQWIEYLELDKDVRIFEIKYNGPVIKRDAKLLNQKTLSINTKDFDKMNAELRLYWSGAFTDDPLPELLITLPAKVIREVCWQK